MFLRRSTKPRCGHRKPDLLGTTRTRDFKSCCMELQALFRYSRVWTLYIVILYIIYIIYNWRWFALFHEMSCSYHLRFSPISSLPWMKRSPQPSSGGRSFHLSPNATEKDHVEHLELCHLGGTFQVLLYYPTEYSTWNQQKQLGGNRIFKGLLWTGEINRLQYCI